MTSTTPQQLDFITAAHEVCASYQLKGFGQFTIWQVRYTDEEYSDDCLDTGGGA